MRFPLPVFDCRHASEKTEMQAESQADQDQEKQYIEWGRKEKCPDALKNAKRDNIRGTKISYRPKEWRLRIGAKISFHA